MRVILLIVRALTLGPYRGFIVRRSVRQVLRSHRESQHQIDRWIHYGAISIDARHLVIWYLVKTNAELARAKSERFDDLLESETRAALSRNGYRAEAVAKISVGLESSENVERAGGWHRYFR